MKGFTMSAVNHGYHRGVKSKLWVINALVAVLFSGFVSATMGQTSSPNGFVAPQCTWYTDIRCSEAGWRLKFSRNWGRDAALWYGLVTNGGCAVGPRASTIMVLGSWPENPAGHVAYVESVGNGRWVVSHSNWRTGNWVRTINNVPIRQTTFEFVPGNPNRVRTVGSTNSYPIRGFIFRAW
jgi:hypothetical protein